MFRIPPRELPLAGLAGVIVRIALFFSQMLTANQLIFKLVGALTGTLYAEILGTAKKTSIAKFMYPAMVPMIPGDLLYQSIMSLIHLDTVNLAVYSLDLVKALFGIALGTMLMPMILHSKSYFKRALKK